MWKVVMLSLYLLESKSFYMSVVPTDQYVAVVVIL